MECECIDGADNADGAAELVTVFNRKARKTHKCSECSGEIKPGQRYENMKGLFDGGWFEEKTCWACLEIRDTFFCSWMSGCIWTELKESDFDIALPDFEALSSEAQQKYIEMMVDE